MRLFLFMNKWKRVSLMQNEHKIIVDRVKERLLSVKNDTDLVQVKSLFLGKDGDITKLMKSMSSLPASERPKRGKEIGELKKVVVSMIDEATKKLKEKILAQRLQDERVDISLPGRGVSVGSLHPLTHVANKIVNILNRAGFELVDGPEVETDYYNFTALNIPEYHPVRSDQDTFHFDNDLLLRTQTSPVQIRACETRDVPVRIISMGKVFRCDSDQTHTPMFHQLEGLLIDKESNFCNLKALLIDLMKSLLGDDIKTRFRPSYFPFTEPSAEVDIMYQKGEAKELDWLEVLGCGMVHPNVLEQMKIDPELYQGFAFGIGLDRLTMLYYGIHDLRLMFDGDLRFLQQFSTEDL